MQIVICPLSNTWEHKKVQMTHNKTIIIFYDIFRHLELEEECFEGSKIMEEAFVAKSSNVVVSSTHKKKSSYPKSKKKWLKNKVSGGKHQFKKCPMNKKKIKYFNCKTKGHFSREYTEMKKVHPIPFVSNGFKFFVIVAFF